VVQQLQSHSFACRYSWLVLVDLDRDADCAPLLRKPVLSHPAH